MLEIQSSLLRLKLVWYLAYWSLKSLPYLKKDFDFIIELSGKVFKLKNNFSQVLKMILRCNRNSLYLTLLFIRCLLRATVHFKFFLPIAPLLPKFKSCYSQTCSQRSFRFLWLFETNLHINNFDRFPLVQNFLMGNGNSLPDIPGGGNEGYHVLRVQVNINIIAFEFLNFTMRFFLRIFSVFTII